MVQDVLVNLATGLAVFVLDVILVVWLLPKILQRRLEARWMPTRVAFARRATESYAEIVSSLSGCTRQDYWKEPVTLKSAQSLKNEISFFIVGLDPEMTALGAAYLRSTEQVLDRIESVRVIFQKIDNGRLNPMWKSSGSNNVHWLKDELLQQYRLVRALRDHVRLEPPDDENMKLGLMSLDAVAGYFARLPECAGFLADDTPARGTPGDSAQPSLDAARHTRSSSMPAPQLVTGHDLPRTSPTVK
jgi:hypothetical protein